MPCQIGNPNSIFPDFSCSKPRIWNIWWVMLAFHKKIVVYTSQIMKSTLSSGWWHLCWLHDPKKPTSGTIHSTTTWGMASKFSPMPIWATSTIWEIFQEEDLHPHQLSCSVEKIWWKNLWKWPPTSKDWGVRAGSQAQPACAGVSWWNV